MKQGIQLNSSFMLYTFSMVMRPNEYIKQIEGLLENTPAVPGLGTGMLI